MASMDSNGKVSNGRHSTVESIHSNDTSSSKSSFKDHDVFIDKKNGKDRDQESQGDTDDVVVSVPYAKLFRYADGWDWLNMAIGSITSVIHGAGFPVMFIFFGLLTTSFTEYGRYEQCNFNYTLCYRMNLTNFNESYWNTQVQAPLDSFKQNNLQFVYYFVYIACAVFLFGSVQVGTWSFQSVRQMKRLRVAYFRSILRQDIGFHDVTSSGELNARLSSDVRKVKDAVGEKVSTLIQYISMTLSGIIIALIFTWRVALVTLAIAPLLVIASALLLKVSNDYSKKELSAYAKAGAIAEEAISSIRTVVAFGCQHKEVGRYVANLDGAKKVGVRRGFMSGFSIGLLYVSMFGMYGLSFWYGTTLVIANTITIGDLTIAFFEILIASFALGTAGSYLGIFSEAKAAAAKIFEVIDRVPEIDVFSDKGEEPNQSSGEILFDDVSFSYPSRPEVEVLKGVSLKVGHGKTVALVGQSGSGKSTVIQLIQRFYDVNSGKVVVGGHDVRNLAVRKHRDLLGVVSQEPVLFETTIAENIRWGREGITDEEVHIAARQANAYNFIMKQPKKFETFVGEGGGQMSGGQKQRIAIARAIARNPKILLLDEATSALDTASESIVQAALEKASAGRTTVVVAHRLSTIRHADKIVAFHDGKVMEEGTHDELLMVKDSVYSNLIRMQSGKDYPEEEDDTIFEEPVKETNMDDDGYVFIRSKSSRRSSKMRRRAMSNSSASSRMLRRRSSISFIPSAYAKELASPDRPFRASVRSRSGSIRGSIREKSYLEELDYNEEDEDLAVAPFCRIIKMNKPEWPYMAAGCLFSAIAGSVDPINAILFAEFLRIFTLSDTDEQSDRAMLYGLLFFGLGVVAFISYTTEATLFAKSGIELTVRLREKAFRSMLRQDISYFDDHRNSTGALCTRLASDASRVQGCTGIRLGVFVKNFSTLAVALGISFYYGWQLTLVTLAFVPFIVLGGLIELQLISGEEQSESSAFDEAGTIAAEAVSNIRTIASLTKEHTVYQLYLEKLSGPVKKALRKSLMIGIGYGYSQCVIFFAYAATFRLGIELVVTGVTSFDNVFKVLTAVIFGAMAIGQNSSFAPDYAEAKVSASRMFALFDASPAIDAYSDEGKSPAHCKGEITLKSVSFRYPTKPNLPILKGCDIIVKPGKTLALVGQSGCGKSTIVQLLQRFYEPEEGQVLLDGHDIRKLNVSWLRQQMGLVSQEPVLFDQSIKENIQYGDCTRTAKDDEIEEAAQNANIHAFISTLPNGYKTSVGAKGGQLSGGQKQRVAIARALLRNPKILLLDEATSALDAESERIVQDALDAARAGRTSIIIAHRLSTVKNADQIAVIDAGRIVEVGTHEQLILKRGVYFSLVNAQLSDKDRS